MAYSALTISTTCGLPSWASVVCGDMSHQDRYWALLFVPTDVDTQDLDIKDVRVVNNYDFLNGIEDYVHRIRITRRQGIGIVWVLL